MIREVDQVKCGEYGMKSKKTVSVVIAGYNEEDIIADAAKKMYETLDDAFETFELILVDDASKDKTYELMKKFAEGKSNVVVLENRVNLNFGASVLRGFMAAKYDYITFTACDLPLAPKDIVLHVNKMEEGCDMLVMERTDYRTTKWRGITSGINQALLHILFPLLTKNTPVLNYSQIYRKRIIRKIVPLARSPIFVWPELIFRAKLLKNSKWKNVRVKCQIDNLRAGAFGHPHDIIWGLYDMFRFRIRLWKRDI